MKSIAADLDIWAEREDEAHTLLLLKEDMVDFLCRMQDKECLTKATEFFETIPIEYFSSPANPKYNNTYSNLFFINNSLINFYILKFYFRLDTYLRAPVYKYHMQNSYNYNDWFLLNNLYLSTISPQERAITITALAQTRFLWIINE